ncbi:MAG: hypothetical protein VKQ33_05780 [Candidatus Sericytochromatia bacterium]|nr:hypothetical protein [Candidatus Sericytochromatia bacterium]
MGHAIQTLGPLLGPLIGFLFTLAAVLFIALRADKTERPGALEALQAAATGGPPPAGEGALGQPAEAPATEAPPAAQPQPGPDAPPPGPDAPQR